MDFGVRIPALFYKSATAQSLVQIPPLSPLKPCQRSSTVSNLIMESSHRHHLGLHHHHHHLCPLRPPQFLPSQNPSFLHFHSCPAACLPPLIFPPQYQFPISTPESSNYHVSEEPQQLQGVAEGEEEEEDVFVMTDEWVEFFAKSQEKRRLEKKQAKIMKKKEKKNNEGTS